MKTLDIETITESLERSFQNCSLNHHQTINSRESSASVVGESSSSSDNANATPEYNPNRLDQQLRFDATVELNSHVSLPYYWEQCLDLETGEIYYINWKTGMKSNEDPRLLTQDNYYFNGDYYSEDKESSYDSEDSTSESSISSSRRQQQQQQHYISEKDSSSSSSSNSNSNSNSNGVLVVAGCKRCFMYFMVPKDVHDCPKCCGQLLQLDNHGRSQNGFP